MVKKQSSAGILIYFKENEEIKFLFLKYKTYWGFAKGIMEENESEEQTAVREAKEETNLDVTIIPGFKHEQRWFFRFENNLIAKKAIFFIAKVSKEQSNEVKISEEHEAYSWLSLNEAEKVMKIKSNKEMLRKAYDFILEYEKQKTLF